jgi:anti-anti-sigma factor
MILPEGLASGVILCKKHTPNYGMLEMKELEVISEMVESTIVLRAVGLVDSNTAPYLQECLLRAVESPDSLVQLDLAEVPHMSSAGLRVLLVAAKTLQKRGARLRLTNVSPNLYNILHITGFTSFIDVNS